MKATVVTIGTFDGVHRGHQRLIAEAIAQARALRAKPAALAFETPPRLYFRPSAEPSILTTPAEKKSLLTRYGLRRVKMLRFGARLAGRTAEQFFRSQVVRGMRARAVVVGYNFAFGKGRQGTGDVLQELGGRYGVRVTIVPPFRQGALPVSSGRIRDYLKAGKIREAEKLLGHRYFCTGRVERGDGRGKILGFPTANLKTDAAKILPPGVYAVRARIGARARAGVANIGTRPTFGSGGMRLEAHFPGLRASLYGRMVTVEFVARLRGERKFPGPEALKRQIARDARRALQLAG